MRKINNKGFTLVEVLAVIAIIAILGLIAVPGVLNSIQNSKKSSYNIMISDIKIAGETLFEEIEYNDTELYQYSDNGTKLDTKVKTEKISADEENLSITQIKTNLQTLVSNGILKGTQKEENGKKIPILTNPIDDKDIGFCKVIIRKYADNTEEAKINYEIISDSTNSSCPKTYDYQKLTKTANMGNYREDYISSTTYYLLNNSYKYYNNLILNSIGNLVVPTDGVTFSNQSVIYIVDHSGKKLLLKLSKNIYQSYEISLQTSSSLTQTLQTNYSYRYSSTVKITHVNGDKLSLISPNSLPVPTLSNRYTLFKTSSVSTSLKVNYLEKVTTENSNYYKVKYTTKTIKKVRSSNFLSDLNYFKNSSSYAFNEYDGTYKLTGSTKNTNVKFLETNQYTCLSDATSCSKLYKVKNVQADEIVLEIYSSKKLT